MKRALVLSLLVLGLRVAAYGGAFTGSWDTNLCLSWAADGGVSDTVVSFDVFYSRLYIDYEVCDWVFGSNVIFDLTGIEYLWFDAAGSLGAFSFTSIIQFDPDAKSFMDWENIAEVSIAGVNFYGLFDMALGALGPDDVRVGSAYGMLADVGDCTFGAEIRFGAGGHIYWAYVFGVQGWYGHSDGYELCPGYFLITAGNGTGADCNPGFTGLSLMVKFPFTCLDVIALADFSCLNGFDQVCFLLEQIDLGAGWFNIDTMSICYQTGSKSICVDLDLTLGDAVCVTPYFDIVTQTQSFTDGRAYLIDGIALNALTLTYNYNGVTFKAGEIFNHVWERESASVTAWDDCDKMNQYWAFTPTGSITRFTLPQYGLQCAFNVIDGDVTIYPNEMFGVSIDGDSCCGGAYDVDLYNFFMAGTEVQYGIFGWVGTYAGLSVDIGTNTTIGASLTISYLGVESLCFNFSFGW